MKTNSKDNACMSPLKLEGMHITVNVHYSMYNAYKLNLFKLRVRFVMANDIDKKY